MSVYRTIGSLVYHNDAVLTHLGLSPGEPPDEKTFLQGFQPGLTQTGLYGHRRPLQALKISDSRRVYVAITKALISCTITVQLIYAFDLLKIFHKSKFIILRVRLR